MISKVKPVYVYILDFTNVQIYWKQQRVEVIQVLNVSPEIELKIFPSFTDFLAKI